MKLWKRNVIAAAIVLFVCGAVYLNWSYSQDTAAGKNLGEAALVGQTDPLQNAEEGNQDAAAQEGGGAEGDAATQEGQAAGESSSSPPPASTASRPGTTPSPCSRRRPRMRRPTRPPWTRPTRPSRPWPTPP